MRLHELHKAPVTGFREYMDIDDGKYVGTDVLAFFHKYGFKYAGQGSFGIVMTHPDLDYVVKVFDSADGGYHGFINFVKEYKPSEYLPKFIGKPMKITNTMHAIRMEKLSNDIPSEFATTFVSLQTAMAHPTYDHGKVEAYDEHPEELVDLVYDLSVYALRNDLGTDLRSGNVLMRGNTPVIIDPYYKI